MIKKRATMFHAFRLIKDGEPVSNDNTEHMTLDEAVNELIEKFDEEVNDALFAEKETYDLFENCAKNINDLFFNKLNFSKNGNVMMFEAIPITINSDCDGDLKGSYTTNRYGFSVFGKDIESLIFGNLDFYTRNEENKMRAVFEPNFILMKHLLRNGIMNLKVISVRDRRNTRDNSVSSEELFRIAFTDVRFYAKYNKSKYWTIKDEVEYKLSNGYYDEDKNQK